MKNTHLAIVITLMVTIIVDVMGVGLVFPILPGLFYDSTQALVSVDMSQSMRHFLYCVCLSIWPIGIFFGAPYMGDLSDKLSRKKVILLCLFGMIFSNAVSGIAVYEHSLWLFILARFFAGFFGGSFPIAQAVMIDISDEQTKARNLSLVTLAGSVGFVIGPIITAISTLPFLSEIFNYTTPFYVATVVSLLNFLSVWYFLPEVPSNNPVSKIHLFKGVFVIRDIVLDVRTQKLLLGFFLMFVGWGTYFSNLPLLLAQYFSYNTSSIALIFALFAVGNIVGILVLQPYLLKTFNLNQCSVITAIVLAIIVGVSGFTACSWIQWLVAFFAPMVQVVLYTATVTLFSNAVTPQEQGKVMGGAEAAMSLAFFVNSIVLGIFIQINVVIPVLIAAFLIFMSARWFK